MHRATALSYLWQVCDGLAFFWMALSTMNDFLLHVCAFMVSAEISMEILKWGLVLPSFLWSRKTEPRSPNSQSPQQATSDQNCYCTSWAHFSWWPDQVTTAHINQPTLSLLNSFWWNHYLIKNVLTSPINVGSQDQKDYKKSQCDSKWKTYSCFSLCSLISTADSHPAEPWHMHSTFVYEITCLFCSSPCYSCFLAPTPHSCS